MKMNKTSILKAIGLLAICIPLICFCTVPFQVQDDPLEPVENPLYISAKAQVITTTVKNLSTIYSLYPDKDKITINDTQTDKNYMWTRIENEWINLYQYRSPDDRKKIDISVSENKTGKERQYVLGISSTFHEGTLTIIQRSY